MSCRIFLLSSFLQGSDKIDHPRAPALFVISFLMLAVLHMFNSSVLQGSSEVRNSYDEKCYQF